MTNVDQTLSQIDPSTLAVQSAPNTGYRGVAVGEGAIWTVGYQGLVHVNREDVVVRTISQAGFSPFAVATGAGAVWVVDDELNSLWKFDPRTDRLVKRIPLGFVPGGVAFGRGRVWVTDNAASKLVEIDPGADRIVRWIPVGKGPIGVAVGDGSVWTANYRAGTVSRIDPRTGTTVPIKVGLYPKAIAVAKEGAWVVVRGSRD